MTSDGKNLYTWNDEDRLVSATPLFPRHGDLKLTYTCDPQARRMYTDRFTFDSGSFQGPDPPSAYAQMFLNTKHSADPDLTTTSKK